MIAPRPVKVAVWITLLTFIAVAVVVASCRHQRNGNDPTGNGRTATGGADKVLTNKDIRELAPPSMLGVGGFLLTIAHGEKMNIPATTVQLPTLPARRAPMVLYLRVPPGQAERLKALGGTAEFVLQNGNRSMGGQVRLADLRVTTSPRLPGDLLYSDAAWVESLDGGHDWQPNTATVAVNPQNDMAGPIDAVIMAGGYK